MSNTIEQKFADVTSLAFMSHKLQRDRKKRKASAVTPSVVGYNILGMTADIGKILLMTLQDSAPSSCAIIGNDDKLIMLGQVNDDLFQYDLLSPSDIQNADFATNAVQIDIGTTYTMTATRTIRVNPQQTKLWISDTSLKVIRQFSFNTAGTLANGITYDNVQLDVSAQVQTMEGFTLSHDGTKIYVLDSFYDNINQWVLGTAYDLGGTVTYEKESVNISSVLTTDAVAKGISVNSDTSEMYIVGTQNDKVHVVSFGTPKDVATLSYTGTHTTVFVNPLDICHNSNGSKTYVLDSADTLIQHSSVV